jgi:hypothetical protein
MIALPLLQRAISDVNDLRRSAAFARGFQTHVRVFVMRRFVRELLIPLIRTRRYARTEFQSHRHEGIAAGLEAAHAKRHYSPRHQAGEHLPD